MYTAQGIDIDMIFDEYKKENNLRIMSSKTRDNYNMCIDLFIRYIKEHELSVDKEAVLLWQKHLLEKDRPLSKSSVIRYITDLKTFFQWAVDSGYMDETPFKNYRSTLRKDPTNKNYLTTDEFETFLNFNVNSIRREDRTEFFINWLFMCVLLTTGVRVDSASRIRLCDVDFEAGTIYLHKAKGDISYSVSVSDDILEKIKHYIKVLRPQSIPDEAPLFLKRIPVNMMHKFTAKNGYMKRIWRAGNGTYYAPIHERHISHRTCPKYTMDICGKALTAHEFRHSHAMYLYEKGVPIEVISEQLGHSSVSITQNYLHGLQRSTLKKHTQAVWDNLKQGTDVHALQIRKA